ncbi:hypothetical protein NFI96_003696 [Prochilodus magdalenae]|nr:hypothetical protein NFI96_003696 [Prochilodus magdalenae]
MLSGGDVRYDVQEDTVVLPALPRVAVCGGTHGNELSGVYLVRERLKKRKKGQVIEPVTVMTREMATIPVRYIHYDIPKSEAYSLDSVGKHGFGECLTNRSEIIAIVSTATDNLHAHLVASEWKYKVGVSDKVASEWKYKVGVSDKVASEWKYKVGVSDKVASEWKYKVGVSDKVASEWKYKVGVSDKVASEWKYKVGVSDKVASEWKYKVGVSYKVASEWQYKVGVSNKVATMEIGPQPHGLIRSNIFTAMQEAVQLLLDWVRLFNSGTQFEGGSVDVYTLVKNIDYPRDPHTHTIIAAVHPDLQDRDFCLLHPGDPMFLTFSGETLRYKGKEPLYPFFINESAYYEKAVALSLARRRKVEIPAIRSSRTLYLETHPRANDLNTVPKNCNTNS